MKKYINYFFIALIVFGFIAGAKNYGNIENVIEIISKAKIFGLLIALTLTVFIVYLQSELIQIIYFRFGVKERLSNLAIVILAVNFANFVLPSIGFSGVSLFALDAKKRGVNFQTAIITKILYYFNYFISFSIILFFTFIYLSIAVGLNVFQLIGGLLFLIVIILMGSVIYSFSHSQKRSLKVLTLLVAFANTPYKWLSQKELIVKTRIEDFASQMYNDLLKIKKIKNVWRIPLLYGFLIHLCNILLLAFVFISFSSPVPFQIIVSGFTMAVLFSLISITPSGIGFVEGAMVLIFNSLGIDFNTALVVTLAYRGFQFWLPFLLGIIALRKIRLN